MAETIIKGIVVKKQDYQEFDQVIKIFTKSGFEDMIALGVRKITSKNRIALELGNYVEIEYFKSRLNNKLSKLKKAHLIKQIDLHVSDNAQVILEIIKLINKYSETNKHVYQSLINSYKFWGEKYNHHILTIIKFSLLKDLGINPVMNYCVDCHSFKNINGFSLYKGGFTCIKHTKTKLSLYELKSWQKLNKGINEYKSVEIKINFDISKKINNYLSEITF